MERELKRKPDSAKRHYQRLSSRQIQNIQTLAKKGLSLKSISAELHGSKTTVYSHVKESCKKMTYINLNALSEKEQGYLVGMFVGDGNLIVKKERGRYLTKFALDAKRDQDIADHLSCIFKKAGKRITRYMERDSLTVKVYSKEFAEFLLKHVTYIKQTGSRRRVKILTNPEK